MQQYLCNWHCLKVCTKKLVWHKFQSRNEKWNQWGTRTIIFSVLSRSISHLRSVFSISSFLLLAFALSSKLAKYSLKPEFDCTQKKLIHKMKPDERWFTQDRKDSGHSRKCVPGPRMTVVTRKATWGTPGKLIKLSCGSLSHYIQQIQMHIRKNINENISQYVWI